MTRLRFETNALFLLCLFALTAAELALASDVEAQSNIVARKFIQQLAACNYVKAAELVSPVVSNQLNAGLLSTVWQQLTAQLGNFSSIKESDTKQQGIHEIVSVKCAFAKGEQTIIVPLDETHRVVGFFLPRMNTAYTPPAYVDKTAFHEEPITVGTGKYALPGTLSIPTSGKPPYTAVVLVHGSGPNDRDETIGPNKPFRDLAWGLASKGIAVLRYDKRTFAHPKELQAEPKLTMQNNVIDDAHLAIEAAAASPLVNKKRIFLLGHSLGGYVAPDVARHDPQLAGIIVMSGPARPQEDVIMEQMRYLSEVQGNPTKEGLAAMEKTVARIKEHAFDDETPASALLLFPGSIWDYFKSYNPVATASKLGMPILVLQGERDYQVTMEDFALWKKGLRDNPRASFISYPSLNHLYQEGSGKATPREYAKEGHVAQYVVSDIANFVRAGERAPDIVPMILPQLLRSK